MPVSLLHEEIVPCRSASHLAPIDTYALLLGLSTKGQAHVLSGAADAMDVDTAELVGAAIVNEPAQAYSGEAEEAAAGAFKKGEPGAGWIAEDGAAPHALAPAGVEEQVGAALQWPATAATGSGLEAGGSRYGTPVQLEVAAAARGGAAEHSARANPSPAAGDDMLCKAED